MVLLCDAVKGELLLGAYITYSTDEFKRVPDLRLEDWEP